MTDMQDHPAAVKSALAIIQADNTPPHPARVNGGMEVVGSVLDVTKTKAILAKASPMPWKFIIGRQYPTRIDILDANGKMLAHFHPTSPVGEQTSNWENDAVCMIHLTEIIKALETKKET